MDGRGGEPQTRRGVPEKEASWEKKLYVESLVLYFLARRTQELNQTAFLFKAWSRLMCVVGN